MYILTATVNKTKTTADGDEFATPVLQKAFAIDTFEAAKAKYKEVLFEIIGTYKALPMSKGKYKSLKDFAVDGDFEPDKKAFQVIDSINKALTEPDFNGTLPKKLSETDGWTYIVCNKDGVYTDNDGTVLQLNSVDMSDPDKTYFFNFKSGDDCNEIHLLLAKAE